MGDYIGKDNSFDSKMPLEKICDWDKLEELKSHGAEFGWHTWSHRDLTKLSYDEILKEIEPPIEMKYFAYPYGRFNDRVIKAVKEMGYEYAFSVNRGDNSRYQKLRKYL
jgi:peptidoglycan/xylan/chitin deacetylase (PgdA/CDA1 family)